MAYKFCLKKKKEVPESHQNFLVSVFISIIQSIAMYESLVYTLEKQT
jgi:hypothetical protein